MGPELEIVVLEMTPEEQVARIRARHEGTGTNSEDAVDYMKVGEEKKKIYFGYKTGHNVQWWERYL